MTDAVRPDVAAAPKEDIQKSAWQQPSLRRVDVATRTESTFVFGGVDDGKFS